ncbi:MAG: hypothetical protein KGS72_21335 [Cyanobacteria bacterium REEB67]|nr:hypothetical protein [Cyanobacteria bacterium REEB67]
MGFDSGDRRDDGTNSAGGSVAGHTEYTDRAGRDAAATQNSGLSINDIDFSVSSGRPKDTANLAQIVGAPADSEREHLPRPPYDPLTTGDKVASVADFFGSAAGGAYALNRFRNEGMHVLGTDIKSLDRLASSSELHEFKNLGTSLRSEIGALTHSAQRDVLHLQESRPELFDLNASRGTYADRLLKVPKWNLLNPSERALIDKAGNLEYLGESLRRGINTTNTANFKSGLNMLNGLHKNPTAVSEGLSPALRRLEDLGYRVNEQAAESTVSLAGESRALMLKNIGVVGAGIGANMLIEKYLLKNSAPSSITIATDIVSPSIILTELPLWAKFGVIVGAHAVTRFAEYGMNKYGHEK